VLLEKDGEDHLNRSCEEWRSISKNQGGEDYATHTINGRKANWIGHILRRNCLLKSRYGRKDRGKNRSDKEEYVSSCWMTMRNREDTVNWKRTHWIALWGEIALEETVDLS
jgi:hypothetical protein